MTGLIESHSAKTNQHPYDAILEDKYVGENSLDKGQFIFPPAFFFEGSFHISEESIMAVLPERRRSGSFCCSHDIFSRYKA